MCGDRQPWGAHFHCGACCPIQEGFRTLCVAYKILSSEEYAQADAGLREARLALQDREEKLMAVYNQVETGMSLIGATAVEDRYVVTWCNCAFLSTVPTSPFPSLLLKITGKPQKSALIKKLQNVTHCKRVFQTLLFSVRLCSVAVTFTFFFCNLFMQLPNFLPQFFNFQHFRPWLHAIRFLVVSVLPNLIPAQ